MFNNIKTLCELNGISGRENIVAQEIINQIEKICTKCYIDALGNVIAFKKGDKTPKNKIMLSAHMDEVGMILTGVTDDGMLRFGAVGGISPKVILGRKVFISEKKIIGVIGTKAIHHQDEKERESVVKIDDMLIDIGANSKEDALNFVSLGDSICFIGDYHEFGKDFILAKAIDDRAGCAILIEIMKQNLLFDTYFAFSVQEEVGLIGATTATYQIEPDIAIIVETTASGDVSGVTGEKRVSVVGEGAVVSYMDNHTIYNKELYDIAFSIAKKHNIPCQTKTMIAGGNDSGAIQVSKSGVKTVAVSIPSKYIHSASNVVKKSDVIAVYDLALALTNIIGDV